MPRRKPSPQRTLPGLTPPPSGARDDTPVTLPMREVHSGTDRAWFLVPLGVGSGKAAFAPRSKVTRGEGPQASQFTMPRWVAVENGWLK
jgi:hypothetical protein